MSRRSLPLLRAIVLSYKNAARRAYRSNPELCILTAVVLAVLYLGLIAVQVQALATTIDRSTLSQLQVGRLREVSLAAATSVAAVAAGAHLFLGFIDTAAPSLSMLAASKNIGFVQRAWSLATFDIACSFAAGLAVAGPISFLTMFQVAELSGSGSAPVRSFACAACAAVSAALCGVATSSLAATVAQLGTRRWASRQVVQSISMMVQGLLVISAVAVVLSGRTAGLLILCPPFVILRDASSLVAVAGLAVASVAWLAVIVTLNGLGDAHALVKRRSGRSAVHSGGTGILERIGVLFCLRDPMYLATMVLTLLVSLLMRVLVWSDRLDRSQADLVTLIVVSMAGLALITSMFQIAVSGWMLVVRGDAYSRVIKSVLRSSLAMAVLIAFLAIVVQGGLSNVAGATVKAASLAFSTLAALLASVLVFKGTVSPESRGSLLAAGGLSIVLVSAAWTLFAQIPDTSSVVVSLSAQLLGCVLLAVLTLWIAKRREGAG